MRRWILSIIFILLIGALSSLLIWAFFHTKRQVPTRVEEKPRFVPVVVKRIEPQTFIRFVEAYATVFPARRGTVGAEVSGPIVLIPEGMDAGVRVKEGQELAYIKDTTFRMRLEKAKARLEKLRALLEMERNENRKKEALFRIARERLRIAETDYQRKEALFQKALVSRQALDMARSQLEQYRSEYQKARWEMQNLDARIRSIEADIASAREDLKMAQEDLRNTVIRAPFDGIIGERLIDLGDQVRPGQPLFSILDVSWVRVIAQVPSIYIPNVKVGKAVQVITRAYPKKIFRGRIRSVHVEGDPKDRTFKVEVRVENLNPDRLLPGMFARVRIPLQLVKGALLVPRDSVMEEDDVPYVFVVDSKALRAIRKEVILGPTTQEEAQVIKGVEVGDLIVTQGQRLLHNGAAVRIVGDLKG